MSDLLGQIKCSAKAKGCIAISMKQNWNRVFAFQGRAVRLRGDVP